MLYRRGSCHSGVDHAALSLKYVSSREIHLVRVVLLPHAFLSAVPGGSTTNTTLGWGSDAIAVYYGGSGCTANALCAEGAGDCDADSDCNAGLRCFQRNGNEEIPGIASMAGMPTGYDFCYDPTSASPTVYGHTGDALACMRCSIWRVIRSMGYVRFELV